MGIGLVQEFIADEAGVAALDYGFFVAFVAAALLVGAEYLAASAESLYDTVGEAVGTAVSKAIGP
jgi:Flp pilus assembly pilin Flp